ncbi:AbrB/MazE/SpoVT family DNA-binding domain-containing protein [Thermoflexus sp.]|uniref:AbrB/MazE/SpoVT family DNA-binding domain-containing protein n=1 Tax=Thermoflexus sp. TaxID=1969742 RepID=UPI0025E319C6|nr:AbrB/MazE/SpoVT family DNA-binding domain-containing protein [Thermoflexus sp.]MDW8064593.1 AbrB/MazE/SpoVT family DNA-binding domain-containing protein [Anaerolineae bacterium]MCS6962571.1 AbrB/MazE/SpoVT family DNA-binding domain-containing protein [Thermoflexus sp.]MCS7351840.1 AbrB/MazE/SpoVT family DNA-binding domain-containing protein [Thermoflexus sp.]MCX7690380.1 AbrB/MazE/SpoVT family DNA-binding domain-containing protein [Thermoflexus sp.]MDW8181299.1 AbrB/MazE/SpoVT family DNA-bi
MTIVVLSSKGQIVLPREIRKALGVRKGDRFVVTLEGDRVILTRVPAPAPGNWRSWRGRLAGSGVLQAHLAEHADEVQRG